MSLIIKLAERPAELPQVFKIRYRVFQIEQGVDPSLEFDDNEDRSDHLLAYLHDKPVGTARIRLINSQTAKLERVAVLPEVRGLGIGRKMMEKALEILRSSSITTIEIHAQTQVQDFYQKLGFEPEGPVFEEAGISHVKMKKKLQ